MATSNKNENYEKYHRWKIDRFDVLKKKIKRILEENPVLPILVPSGLQEAYSPWFVPKPLHCSLSFTNSTQEVYVAHIGAGPDNRVQVWSVDSGSNAGDGDVARQRKKLRVRVTHLAFVASRSIYVASCTDMTLRSYDYDFQLNNKLQLLHSIHSMIYNDHLDLLVTGSAGLVQQWRLNKSLQDPPDVVRQARLRDHFSDGVVPWITYMAHYQDERKLIALSGYAIFILDAATLQEVAFLENRHRFPMTVCAVYWPRQYLITGSQDGVINVWNMYMKSFPCVGTFGGHTDSIITLSIHPTEKLLISASNDNSIRLWRIETFQETYRYDISHNLTNVTVVNSKRLCYTTSNSMQILDLHIFHSLFTVIGSAITKLTCVRTPGTPARILAIGDDGGARLISPVHGNILTTLFPVVTHKPVSYHHDPVEELLYVLLESGGVMIVSTRTNPSHTTQIWKPVKHNERVISMEVCHVMDDECHFRSLVVASHADGRLSIISGLDKVYLTQPNHGIIEQIKSCESLFHKENACDFATCNGKGVVTLWKFSWKGGAATFHAVKDLYMNKGKVQHFTVMMNVALISHQNHLMFVQLDGATGVDTSRYSAKDEQHLSDITEMSSCSSLSVFATASADGCLKVWNIEGLLIREMSFDCTLSGLCFSNNRGDLMVGYQDNLYYVPSHQYLPVHYLELLLHEFVDDVKRIEYCIPFDPALKFWYDPNRVSTVDLFQSCKLKSIVVLDDRSQSDIISDQSASQHSDKSGIEKKSNSFELVTETQNQNHEEKEERVSRALEHAKIIRSLEPLSDHRTIAMNFINHLPFPVPALEETADGEEAVAEKFRAFAPDGHIPNSTVREGHIITRGAPPFQQKWRPPGIDIDMVITEDEDGECFSDEDFDQTRLWFSDEESEISRFHSDYSTVGAKKSFDFASSIKPVAKKSALKPKGSAKKLVKTAVKSITAIKAIPSTAPSLPPVIVETDVKVKPVKESQAHVEEFVPYPFDQYYKEAWFPANTGYQTPAVISALCKKLPDANVVQLMKMLQCVVKANRIAPVDESNVNEVCDVLFGLLERNDGTVRHHVVKALCEFGQRRRDVILKLIPKLSDPVTNVREEVKNTLAQIAGIVDGDTLLKKLEELGEVREVETSNDSEVLESFKERLSTRRDSVRQRLQDLFGAFADKDMQMSAWVEHMLKPLSLPIKKKEKVSRFDDSKSDTASIPGYNYDKERMETTNNDEDEHSDKPKEKDVEEEVPKDEEAKIAVQRNELLDTGDTSSLRRQSVVPSITYSNDVQLQQPLDQNKEENVMISEPSQQSDTVRGINPEDSPDVSSDVTKRRSTSGETEQINPLLVLEENQSGASRRNSLAIPESKRQRRTSNAGLEDVMEQGGPDGKETRVRRESRASLHKTDTTLVSNSSPSNLELSYLNEALKDPKRTVSEAIATIAPHLVKKFNNLQSEGEDLSHFSTTVNLPGGKENDTIESKVKDKPMRRFTVTSPETLKDNAQHSNSNITKKTKRKKKSAAASSKEADSLNSLEHVALATAISALRGRRKQSLTQSGGGGNVNNEVLNNITKLLNLLQQKKVTKYSTIQRMMKQVMELQEELVHGRSQPPNASLYGSDGAALKNFSLPQIRNGMVRGVTGERIVSGLHIHMPKLGSKPPGVIKPIHARNGAETGVNDGVSKYGVIGYEWTTYSSTYDMGETCSNHLPSSKSSAAVCCQATSSEKRMNVSELRSRMKAEMRGGGDLVAPFQYHFNKKTVLPSIMECDADTLRQKQMLHQPAPAPPNTAQGVAR